MTVLPVPSCLLPCGVPHHGTLPRKLRVGLCKAHDAQLTMDSVYTETDSASQPAGAL